MRIGVVSDTHNNLKNCRKIVELFNEAEVERVIHTGDISQVKTLEVFRGLEAECYGVFGNNDVERHLLEPYIAEHGFKIVDPPLELVWLERRILVVHDPRDLEHTMQDHHDLVLHGHTHRQVIERCDKRLLFNPGECAGIMKGFNAIGIVDLIDLSSEIVKF